MKNNEAKIVYTQKVINVIINKYKLLYEYFYYLIILSDSYYRIKLFYNQGRDFIAPKNVVCTKSVFLAKTLKICKIYTFCFISYFRKYSFEFHTYCFG